MTFIEGNRLPCTVEPYNHRILPRPSPRTVILNCGARSIPYWCRVRRIRRCSFQRDRIATINDPTLLQSCKLVLAVRARCPTTVYNASSSSSRKPLPTKSAAVVGACRCRVFRCAPLTAAPRQLPYHEGYVYFELKKARPASINALALHISGSFPDLNLQLWAIRG